MRNNIVFTTLDDDSLLDAAKRLATEERRATAALLRALMEIDSRRLYLGQGCASMFAYCTQVLHLAEGAAYNRIEAARAARNYPVILDLLEESAITLTAVRLLAPHLTTENAAGKRDSWSSTTSSLSRRVGRRQSRTSSCAAALITPSRHRCSSTAAARMWFERRGLRGDQRVWKRGCSSRTCRV